MSKQLEVLIAEMKAAAEKCTSMKADVDENMAYANFIAIIEPSTILALIAALEQEQHEVNRLSQLKTVNAAHAELESEFLRDVECGQQAAEKRIAELDATIELEREKSRRVMSQNHHLEAKK